MISVNLLPSGHSAAFSRARRIRAWVLVCVVEAVGLGSAGWFLTPNADAEERAWSRFVGVSDRLRATNEILAGETAQEQVVSKDASTAERLATARVWSPLLAFLAERTPPEVMLTTLRAQVPVDTIGKSARKPALAPAGPGTKRQPVRRDSTLILEGHAIDHEHLARFMRVLNDSTLFQTVRLDGAERKLFLAGQAIDFSLTCRW